MIATPSTFCVFLSAVSNEFGPHRIMLKADLGLPSVKVQEQSDLIQGGGKLLQTLDDYIRDSCDVVIHLIGRETGNALKPDEVRWLLHTYPGFGQRFPFLVHDLHASPPQLTYTQIEAWLALYHERRCHLYRPVDLQQNPLPDDHPQQQHWQRLRSLGEHRGSFDDAPHLCRGVLRDLHDILPRRPLIFGANARVSTGPLIASLGIIICLLAGMWRTLIVGVNQAKEKPDVNSVADNSRRPSVLFSSSDAADDVRRLAGARPHDVADIARECSHPVIRRLADQLEHEPELLYRFTNLFVEVQSSAKVDVLVLPEEDITKLSTATVDTVISVALQCQNDFLKTLAVEFSDDPSVFLLVTKELCQ